jgi:hypothetical protein
MPPECPASSSGEPTVPDVGDQSTPVTSSRMKLRSMTPSPHLDRCAAAQREEYGGNEHGGVTSRGLIALPHNAIHLQIISQLPGLGVIFPQVSISFFLISGSASTSLAV